MLLLCQMYVTQRLPSVARVVLTTQNSFYARRIWLGMSSWRFLDLVWRLMLHFFQSNDGTGGSSASS